MPGGRRGGRRWLGAAGGAALLAVAVAGPAPVDATAADPVSAAPVGAGAPSIAAWGRGAGVPVYTSTAIWVSPHPDDEGGLWADELNTDATAFPVFVYLTNGENTGACTNESSLLPFRQGNLAAADRPPFNTAGDTRGAPEGYLGDGPPPQANGAQGDDPPVYPRDPPLDRSTGWAPLLSAATVSGTGSDGQRYTEGFSGPCRAARLAATTAMYSRLNRVVRRLSPTADRALFPSMAPGSPPDGQECFSAATNELYSSAAGRYTTPGPSGEWTAASTPPDVVSAKDACAYYWLTPTGDVFAFDLGDMSSGFVTACPSNLSGRLRAGGPWPAGADGYDSVGAYEPGARPGDGSCPGSLPAGQEAYGVTPSDVVWAVQQVVGSGRLPALPVKSLESVGWVNGFNPLGGGGEPGGTGGAGGGIDAGQNTAVTGCAYMTDGESSCASGPPPPGRCQPYASSGHLAAGLALHWNAVLPGVASGAAVCAGDPLAGHPFGTADPDDGIRFWRAVYNYDGGPGWEAAAWAYGWLTGPEGFDPYGNVSDTCPGSDAVQRAGQSQWSCQESVTSSTATAPASPGGGVAGMTNVQVGPTGEGFTLGL